MNRADASEPDSSACGHFPPFQMGRRRGREEDIGEPIEQVKRLKLGGITTPNTEIQNEKITENVRHENEEESTSKISEANSSNKLPHMPIDLNLNSPLEISINDALINSKDSSAFGVDPNDPFYPYKKLGQRIPTAISECGSTNGQMEITESMRKWNEMKQNGFVSTVPLKAPIPRLRRRQSRKKNDKEINKMIDVTKQELKKHTSFPDPSKLLSGLNPGIIKHVRNSKQVNSIIKAMLQNEMLEKPTPPPPRSLKRRSKEAVEKPERQLSDSEYDNGDGDDDDLSLKLSYSATIEPEHGNDDFSSNQKDITSLSVKAANVALQWLKLIQDDIIARQSAIQRSKNRVKNAVEMELPYLFSRDLQPKLEKKPSFGHSFLKKCSQKEAFNVHLARWKAVFTQMEVSLTEEENQLEKWLRQVEELKSQCQEGLRYVNTNGFLHLDVAKEKRIIKSQEAYEREFAVRAAAASIYSTCNMIMTAENVPCF